MINDVNVAGLEIEIMDIMLSAASDKRRLRAPRRRKVQLDNGCNVRDREGESAGRL